MQQKLVSHLKTSNSSGSGNNSKTPTKRRSNSIISIPEKKQMRSVSKENEKSPIRSHHQEPQGFALKPTKMATHFIKSTVENSALNLKEHLEMRKKFHLSLSYKKSNDISYDDPTSQSHISRHHSGLRGQLSSSILVNDSMDDTSGVNSMILNERQDRKSSPTLVRRSSKSNQSYLGLYAQNKNLKMNSENVANQNWKTPAKIQQVLSEVQLNGGENPSTPNLNQSSRYSLLSNHNSASKLSTSAIRNRSPFKGLKESSPMKSNKKILNNSHANGHIRRNRSIF